MMANQMNQAGQMSREQLLNWLNMVSFAVVDITEYLDTHPKDEDALKYFNYYAREREATLHAYAEKYGPLTIDTAKPEKYWDWASMPLPWEGGNC